MTTSNTVTKRRAAMGKELEPCAERGGSAPGLEGPGAAGRASQSQEGRPRVQVGWGGGGRSGRGTGASGVCWTGGLLLHLPRLPAPLLHVSTFRASPPRMPNLAHAICRLSSEIGTRTKAECITSLQLPLHRERRGRAGGPGTRGQAGQPATCLPDFLLTLLPQSQVLGLLGAARWSLEAGQGR